MEVQFSIPVEPVPQGRPRFNSRTKTAHDPSASRSYKRIVSAYAKASGIVEPLDKAIAVEIDIFRTPPKVISGIKKNRVALENETMRPITKPDIDNYAKAIMDACSGIIWKDDNIIAELTVRKFYSLNPRATVKASEINGI